MTETASDEIKLWNELHILSKSYAVLMVLWLLVDIFSDLDPQEPAYTMGQLLGLVLIMRCAFYCADNLAKRLDLKRLGVNLAFVFGLTFSLLMVILMWIVVKLYEHNKKSVDAVEEPEDDV